MPSITVYCAQRQVAGYVEISTSQQFLTHDDERECIMTFVAQELATFSLEGSSCKTYSTQFQ